MQDSAIGRVEGGQGRVHASSTVAVRPAPDTPLRKSPDDRLLNRGAPSSVSLCRSISASLLLRDHVYSTLQTPSRAPSSQRPLPIPSLARSQAPTLSRRSQLPNCPIARFHTNPRLGVHARTHRDLARSYTHKPVDCPALQSYPPPDREGSPIPVLPRRGHAALNMRKRETHPYVSQHNER